MSGELISEVQQSSRGVAVMNRRKYGEENSGNVGSNFHSIAGWKNNIFIDVLHTHRCDTEQGMDGIYWHTGIHLIPQTKRGVGDSTLRWAMRLWSSVHFT